MKTLTFNFNRTLFGLKNGADKAYFEKKVAYLTER